MRSATLRRRRLDSGGHIDADEVEAPLPCHPVITPGNDNGGVHAAAMKFDLHVPESRSLKNKRRAIRPITQGLRQKFRVSVAEVGCHDQWQRAVVALAAVAESTAHLDELLANCERFVYAAPDIEVLDVTTSYLEADG